MKKPILLLLALFLLTSISVAQQAATRSFVDDDVKNMSRFITKEVTSKLGKVGHDKISRLNPDVEASNVHVYQYKHISVSDIKSHIHSKFQVSFSDVHPYSKWELKGRAWTRGYYVGKKTDNPLLFVTFNVYSHKSGRYGGQIQVLTSKLSY